MTKLKGAKLQELAKTLGSAELNSAQMCTVKGGCSSCEDTRRPPKANKNND